MIQNQHQYQVTQNKLKNLERGLIELEKNKNSLHPRQYSGRRNSLVDKIAILDREIVDYESLTQSKTSIEIESIQDLPLALIKVRIARGVTQKELAEKMGVKEQQVQRDEANQYNSAGFHRLSAVATALNIKIQKTSIVW